MNNSHLIVPILKWVGGKRQLLPEIRAILPKDIQSRIYYEPFIGGGSVLFSLKPKIAVINDINEELINVYTTIKNNPLELIEDLKSHKNELDYYYEIRNIDRDKELFSQQSNIKRASRIIYLNKTCFNGLYRVNRKGEYNSAFGYYPDPEIVNEQVITALHQFFNLNDITIKQGDYKNVLKTVPDNAFLFLDPPYDPINPTSNFTRYTTQIWNREAQKKLKEQCDDLTHRRLPFLLSNSDTPFIRELYAEYKISQVQAKRSINCKATNRGKISELFITNY